MKNFFKIKWKTFFMQGLLFAIFTETINYFQGDEFNGIAFSLRFLFFALFSGGFSYLENKRRLNK